MQRRSAGMLAAALVVLATARCPASVSPAIAAAAGTAPARPSEQALAAAPTSSGYWMIDAAGTVYPFGTAGQFGGVAGGGVVDLEPTPTGGGYWILTESGELTTHGDAVFYGRGPQPSLGERYVSMSANPAGGYWLFTSTGRVFAAGGAAHYGDLTGRRLNGSILGSVATPSGRGYWMVGSDGGVFSFGDARFSGSTGSVRLNQPVMALAPDPDGDGYWLVAADGGIFAFDAPFYGSAGSLRLNQPIRGMVAQPGGYLMVAADGGIFSYGTTEFLGSLGDRPPPVPVVAVATVPAPGEEPASPGSSGGLWLHLAVGSSTSYRMLQPDGTGGPKYRWDPCTPHPYVVSTNRATPAFIAAVQQAFRQLSAATGIPFTFAGLVPDIPSTNWTRGKDARWPGQWRPILVGWAAPNETDLDLTGAGGRGGPTAVPTTNPKVVAYVSGVAVLNAYSQMKPGFSPGYSVGTVLLHEVAHVAGLGHVDDPTQIMSSPRPHVGAAAYGAGDLAGLRRLGTGGCLPPIPPRT